MGYIGRNNNFKNLLAVCNVEAVSFTLNSQQKSVCCSATFQNFGK